MLLLLTLMSWTLSAMFIFLNHPLSFGLILLLQTILISLLSGILNLDFWFSYILFLIMVGGMLVLFIYMTSIASNEKFKLSKHLLAMSSLLLMILPIMLMDNFIYSINMNNYDFMNQDFLNMNLSMNKFMNTPLILIMLMLMIYLLMTLIAIVKITQTKMGPLRSIM